MPRFTTLSGRVDVCSIAHTQLMADTRHCVESVKRYTTGSRLPHYVDLSVLVVGK